MIMCSQIIEQKLPFVHKFIHAALFQEWGSAESAGGFSVWVDACVHRTPLSSADAIRAGIVAILVSAHGFTQGSTLFPVHPAQLPVDDLPLTLRFDRLRMSRLRSRIESAVAICAALRTVEHALDALDAPSAPGRLHACYVGLLGCCNNVSFASMVEALCVVVHDELGLRLPALRAALGGCLSSLRHSEVLLWVHQYFSLMSDSVTHAQLAPPNMVPRPSDLMHAYMVSLLSPTVTMFQTMFLVNFTTFKDLYTGALLADDLMEAVQPSPSSSSDSEG